MASKFLSQNQRIGIATLLGLFCGWLNISLVNTVAGTISEVFINLLKLVSLPIIFLSIVSTASGMESIDEIKYLGKKVIRYTLLTTVIAATIALIIFVGIDPVRSHIQSPEIAIEKTTGTPDYLNHLMNVIPS